MKLSGKLAWRSLRKNPARTAVTVIGVVVSSAMFMAVMTMLFSIRSYLIRGFEYETGDFFVSFDRADGAGREAALADPMVRGAADLKVLGFALAFEDLDPIGVYEVAAGDKTFFRRMSVPLTEGRLPEKSGEIVIPERLTAVASFRGEKVPAPGDTLSLPLTEENMPDHWMEYYQSGEWPEAQEKSFTVVGIMEDRNYRPGRYGFYEILTFSDGSEGDPLWYRLFLSCRPADAKALAGKGYGPSSELNSELLYSYGQIGEANEVQVFALFAAVLCLLIVAATVGLIRNVFSVSVAERTREFGLLSGIGATKRQISDVVAAEALILMALGIPLGILCGFGGIAVVIRIFRDPLMSLFSFGDSRVTFTAVFYPLAAAGSAALCALTVAVSTAVPAARASRITPIEAVREQREYRSRKNVRVSSLTRRLFGVPGWLGAKYYKVSRRKFRAAAAALSFSLILFTVAAFFSSRLTTTADSQYVEVFDFGVEMSGDGREEVFREIRESSSVRRSAEVTETNCFAWIRQDLLEKEYREFERLRPSWEDNEPIPQYQNEQIVICFVEDKVLAESLQKEGIEPSSVLNGEAAAVALKQSMSVTLLNSENEREEHRFYGWPLRKEADTVCLRAEAYPFELLEPGESGRFEADEDGAMILVIGRYELLPVEGQIFVPTGKRYLVKADELLSGGMVRNGYYLLDPVTGQPAETPSAQAAELSGEFRIAARLEQRPFGVSVQMGRYGILLLMPLSQKPADVREPVLYLEAVEHGKLRGELEEAAGAHEGLAFGDFRQDEINRRGLVTLVRVAAAGFVILIGVISCANVFNTIYTNVLLRRRDFGMLRSMGFTGKDLIRMEAYECLRYGAAAFVLSVPLSILCCYGLWRIQRISLRAAFELPWGAIGLGVGFIFLTVGISTAYAMAVLRKQSPIEALRTE